jgi:hypothetical protein
LPDLGKLVLMPLVEGVIFCDNADDGSWVHRGLLKEKFGPGAKITFCPCLVFLSIVAAGGAARKGGGRGKETEFSPETILF